MLTNDDKDLIEVYLDGSISDKGREEIEERISDSSFRDEMMFQAKLIDCLFALDSLRAEKALRE